MPMLDLAAAGGLTQFDAALVSVEPGSWSCQRHWHWHRAEDALAVMLGRAGGRACGDGDVPE